MYPETPEGVALALVEMILLRDASLGGNRPTREWLLDLYRECLSAATARWLAPLDDSGGQSTH